MDFETSGKGGNPFLMDDYGGDTTANCNMNSNPFLSNSDFNIPVSSASEQNPFLSSLGEDASTTSPFSGTTSTNPFAFAADDFGSGMDTTTTTTTTTGVDFFGGSGIEQTTTSSAGFNIFSTTETTVVSNQATDDFFGSITSTAPAPELEKVDPIRRVSGAGFDLLDGVDASGDASDFCKETSDIFSNVEASTTMVSMADDDLSRTSTPKSGIGVPRRPPPPRPVPPSKETKDLILSVTGAMEATSSHLLDRLQMTRTPSPTPIRDLHSPSPTPDVPFSDLLGSDLIGEPTEVSEPTTELTSVPPKPPPPRPAPPPRPQPPPAAQPPPEQQQDIMDIFSSDITTQPPAPAPQTNTDILGLFDSSQPTEVAPQTTTTTTDLLLGDDFGVGSGDAVAESKEVNLLSSSPITAMDFTSESQQPTDVFASESFPAMMEASEAPDPTSKPAGGDDFDAFAAKFENAAKDEAQEIRVVEGDPFDPFASSAGAGAAAAAAVDHTGTDVWGSTPMGETKEDDKATGFGADESFDAFLTMTEPPPAPQGTPARFSKQDSGESDEGPDFSIFIKPKEGEAQLEQQIGGGPVPTLAPPPKSPVQNNAFSDSSPRFNPFDKGTELAATAIAATAEEPALPQGAEVPEGMQRTDSQETPPTPLFDEDVSQPLEEFPRLNYQGDGWEMHLRQPNKKKITGQRFWKKVFVHLVYQGDNPVLQLFNTKEDKDPFQELPLQACYSVSDIGAQQFDQYGKIFTVKLQYVFYKERPGVRPGQVTKAERITNKLSQFAKYAIEGDYQGCKEFGSDLRKLGLPVEHAPQISQLFKIGSQTYEDMKQFSVCVEEALFRLSVHRDRALNYKTEEVQITVVDELYVEQDKYGHIDKQIARVRLFFLGFLAGMPDIELGVNDLWRQGKEVVGRHDIIPVITEEWIRLELVEFHSCVQQDEYERTRVIKFKPPDACYIELMRFRVRPPKNRELPLQLKTVMCITGNKIELKADILVPGFSSRKLGQIPCEDIMVRFPIPECWIYLFRVEKHFRYGSVKSAHRRTGKVKGIERLLGTVETLEQSLIEVTSGQAKYEHQHRAIVWRMARLPKEGQGAYTTHSFVCRFGLTSYDQIPEQLAEYCYVEFTMPATQVSHTTVRSVSVTNGAKDDPPEKYVRYLARHEYRVGIEHTQGEGPGAYIAATLSKTPETNTTIEEKPEPPAAPAADSDSDSSS